MQQLSRYNRPVSLLVTLVMISIRSLLALAACTTSVSFAADISLLQAYGQDMGRAQRCGAVPAEVLLYSQLARDLADPLGAKAYEAFLAAGAKGRESQPADCPGALARFDAAMGELYKHLGRSQD